ncbi:hypothetical protein MLD38_019860 [Melastoma candidum]|uniref:Uncharacterized protein n=1 Tax=Melastoma candidum TaxID=119954 RepID=A0ACB9QD06_9MYRT|nr:hypothetical protein MLD38_019860 [Melastoma candidum]
MASLSFRWFVDVKTSPGGLDVSVRQSGDASDEETFIEIDLGTPPSKGIRVISVPVDSEFSFPSLESRAPLAFADELFSGSPERPHLTKPRCHGSSPPRKKPVRCFKTGPESR